MKAKNPSEASQLEDIPKWQETKITITRPPQYYNCLMETGFEVHRPCCGEGIWVEFYPEDGLDQETIMDFGVAVLLSLSKFSLTMREGRRFW